MRVRACALLIGFTAAGLASGGSAFAQDLCGNIRLSAAEQIECRGRLANALGEGDHARIQREFEDRVRRANDQLIAPPTLKSQPPPMVGSFPSTAAPVLPAPPVPPATPPLPGASSTSPATSGAPAGSLPAPPAGSLAEPGGTLPSGRPIAPDLTAPDPAASPLPPISPLPAAPSGSLPPGK